MIEVMKGLGHDLVKACFGRRAGRLAITLFAGLLAAFPPVQAREPCGIFEGGRVDLRIIEEMRAAARSGRLYRVVPGVSRVGFCVRHFPLQEFRGDFTNLAGGLVLPSASEPQGKALLLIRTTPLEASNEALAPLVRGSQFMDTERFPDILFVGHRFEWHESHGHVYGDLTLRGVTQPVQFDVRLETLLEGVDGGVERMLLTGVGQVNRYQFDMRSHQLFVSESVRLCLSVELDPWRP